MTFYLKQLTSDQRGSILRGGADNKYRFVDPLHHTFAQAILAPSHKPKELGTGMEWLVSDSISKVFTIDYDAVLSNTKWGSIIVYDPKDRQTPLFTLNETGEIDLSDAPDEVEETPP